MTDSTSATAAQLLDQSRLSYVRWRRDSMALLDESLALDPQSATAHSVRGLYLHMARNIGYRDMIDESRQNARQCVGSDPIEQLYVRGLEAASDGELTRMACCFEEVLLHNPLDIFALRMCQSELFWLGEMAWSENISASVARHWHESTPHFGAYMSVRAFDLEETGQFKQAEACGRRAVEIDPADPWGTHAVAHVLYMQGRCSEGADWLDGLHGNWSELSQIMLHLWWHRALFSLEQDDLSGALMIYDDYVRNLQLEMVSELSDLYIDLQNAASLLIRLELRGHAVGNRWEELADIASVRKIDHSNPFTSAHFAMMLAAANRDSELPELLASMHDWARDSVSLSPRIINAALPAAKAAIAHRAGRHREVVETLMPARRMLWQMGGSHAQRDVFFLLLADSLQQLGRLDQLGVVKRDIEAAGFADSMVQRIAG